MLDLKPLFFLRVRACYWIEIENCHSPAMHSSLNGDWQMTMYCWQFFVLSLVAKLADLRLYSDYCSPYDLLCRALFRMLQMQSVACAEHNTDLLEKLSLACIRTQNKIVDPHVNQVTRNLECFPLYWGLLQSEIKGSNGLDRKVAHPLY